MLDKFCGGEAVSRLALSVFYILILTLCSDHTFTSFTRSRLCLYLGPSLKFIMMLLLEKLQL